MRSTPWYNNEDRLPECFLQLTDFLLKSLHPSLLLLSGYWKPVNASMNVGLTLWDIDACIIHFFHVSSIDSVSGDSCVVDVYYEERARSRGDCQLGWADTRVVYALW